MPNSTTPEGTNLNTDERETLEGTAVGRGRQWQGTLGDMFAAVSHALRQQPIAAPDVERAAEAVSMSICTALGGRVVYLPRGAAVRRELRDTRLFNDWREGHLRPAALAQKYRLSVQTVYEIIARQRELARKREPDQRGFGQES
jgi:Mor family transcriptional regulator